VTAPSNRAVAAVALFALLGAILAAVSTYDFVAHLDRQVHAITCAFVPGLAAPDAAGTSGCHLALMSPYSALARRLTWGGIPIALPALAVFAFILFRAGDLLLTSRARDAHKTAFLAAAAALPVLASLVYFLLSVLRLGALCRLCVGIYVAAIACFVAAVLAHGEALKVAAPGPRPWGRWAVAFAEGVVFVVVPVVLYLALKPSVPSSLTGCGRLLHSEDRYGVRVRLPGLGRVPAIEVLDPLCPACRNLDLRLELSGLADTFARELVLFPLDKECNWMVSESLHPGGCAASEAVLCAGTRVSEVLAFLFAHQDELRTLGEGGEQPVLDRIAAQFPELRGCLGKPAVRSRLNRSLRWVVSNSLPVLTPQLFVGGTKVCDEDTDLGLEYVVSRMLAARPAPAR